MSWTLAPHKGHEKVVKVLLEAGARVDERHPDKRGGDVRHVNY